MSPSEIQQFLLILDVVHGVTEVRELGTDYDKALVAYQAAEAAHRGHSNYDIVLVGSDSLETVKRTHASYFEMPDLRRWVEREIAAAGAA